MLVLCNFALAILAIQGRHKKAKGSPYNFNLAFYFKDTGLEIVLSLLLTLVVGAIYFFGLDAFVELGLLNLGDRLNLTEAVTDNTLTAVRTVLAIFIGLRPKMWLQRLKKEGNSLVQPSKVKVQGIVYDRTNDTNSGISNIV